MFGRLVCCLSRFIVFAIVDIRLLHHGQQSIEIVYMCVAQCVSKVVGLALAFAADHKEFLDLKPRNINSTPCN